jgi:hypothetical protein
MTTVHIAANPFALLMYPESVIAAVERSERLARLKSRVWRPLDKPLSTAVSPDTATFDDLIEAAGDTVD